LRVEKARTDVLRVRYSRYMGHKIEATDGSQEAAIKIKNKIKIKNSNQSTPTHPGKKRRKVE
jgi:hypothetical protein